MIKITVSEFFIALTSYKPLKSSSTKVWSPKLLWYTSVDDACRTQIKKQRGYQTVHVNKLNFDRCFTFQTDIQNAQFTTDASGSRLTYIAKTDLDYGTMTCFASNEVGESNKPCIFQIVRDGKLKFQVSCLLWWVLKGILLSDLGVKAKDS